MKGKIKQLIEAKFGKRIRYPKDCEALAMQISSSTSQAVSASTLKRLFGFIQPASNPSLFTLDTIAMFLGYEDWKELSYEVDYINISEINYSNTLFSDKIPTGDLIIINYSSSKSMTLEHLGASKFKVLSSENSSLHPNDIIEVHAFANGFPLLASNVIRNGINLGNYIAGKGTGVVYIHAPKPT